MILADTLRGLARRWYIVIPGLLLATFLTITTFAMIKPDYERAATQLLLPGEGTIPTGATNPFLFLGGLTQSADVLVRSMNAEEVAGAIVKDYPGTEVAISKDPSTSGPIILIRVTATSNSRADGALNDVLASSADVLERLQIEQDVATVDRITITTLTRDGSSTLQQRKRLTATIGVGAGMVVLTVLIASLVEGLSRRARPGDRGSESSRVVSSEATDESDPAESIGDQAVIDSEMVARGRRKLRLWSRRGGHGRVAGRDRAGLVLPDNDKTSESGMRPARQAEDFAG